VLLNTILPKRPSRETTRDTGVGSVVGAGGGTAVGITGTGVTLGERFAESVGGGGVGGTGLVS
jgi:hypothetical protein